MTGPLRRRGSQRRRASRTQYDRQALTSDDYQRQAVEIVEDKVAQPAPAPPMPGPTPPEPEPAPKPDEDDDENEEDAEQDN